MRRALLIAALVSSSITFSEELLHAEEQTRGKGVVSAEYLAAYQSYQSAHDKLLLYRFVDLPRQRRALDDQIRLTEIEVSVLARRVASYQPFLRVKQGYSPVRTAAESYYLELIATEQQLRQLRDDRIALMRLSREQSRHHAAQAIRAARRMAILRPSQVDEDAAP